MVVGENKPHYQMNKLEEREISLAFRNEIFKMLQVLRI